MEDNSIWGCGDNLWDQLGIGDGEGDQRYPVRVLDGDMNTPSTYLEDINDIDSGWKHSLALDVNGFVWAWGDNEQGELGNGEGGPDSYSTTPVQVLSGEQDPNNANTFLQYIESISAGRSGEHSLALDSNSFVWAWGRNFWGQCGNGNDGYGERELTPVQVQDGEMATTSGFLEDINAISAAANCSMALDANGFVWTWGGNRTRIEGGSSGYGVLGIGTEDQLQNTPVQVLSGEQDPNDPNSHLQNIVAISAGWDHCMALEKYEGYDGSKAMSDPNYTGPDPNFKGRVYTWGSNGQGWDSDGGRLGDGTTDDRYTPVFVLSGEQEPNDPNSYLKDIVAISAGEGHSLALDIAGCVWAWGENRDRQLGNGTNVDSLTPVKVKGVNGVGYLQNIVKISAGYWHCIAIGADGTIYTWGSCANGRLGLGNINDNRDTPCRVGILYNQEQQAIYFEMQDAIDDADSNDTVSASMSVYKRYQTVEFDNIDITLKSSDPNDPYVVENTVIDGVDYYNPVKFVNGADSTFDGFTVTRGITGITVNASTAQIKNCIISDCGKYGLDCKSSAVVTATNTDILNNGEDVEIGFGIYCNGSEISLSNCSVKDSAATGIYCSNSSSLTLTKSTISGNGYISYPQGSGISCSSSNLAVAQCIIFDNAADGIKNTSSSFVQITNSIISQNEDHGIYLNSDNTNDIEIKNNWIYGNGTDGIYIYYADPVDAVIRNNTIADNNDYGIHVYKGTEVTVSNCIIWGNFDGSLCKDNNNFDNITYSCIAGGFDGNGNISSAPIFIDDANDPNNYHLASDSPCIDKGDPNLTPDTNETDIFGDDRIIDGDGNDTEIVDMGADEYYLSPADFDGDGVVNFVDYAIYAAAWQESLGDPNYNDECDLEDNNAIDYNDLDLFAADWLWPDSSTQSSEMNLGRGMDGGGKFLEQSYSAELAKEASSKPRSPAETIDFLEKLWDDNQGLQKIIGEEKWDNFIDTLKKTQ